jgi:RNA polymerase sigma-70 factor (ECF subfamily)
VERNSAEGDRDLVERCRRGEQVAWRELVQHHSGHVFGLCYRFVGRVDQAEDLTQETFARAYQQMDRYRESDGSFGAWLTAIGKNLAIDHWRRVRHERERSTPMDDLTQIPAADGSPERMLERNERVRLVHRGLRALPADLRMPLVLCDLAGLAYEEIAHTLALPLGTVKSRINRGRLELARRLVGLGGAALAGE